MDSWLHEEANEVVDLDSDSEDAECELESRLYAIIHHNDLSQPLPAELAKHYSLQHSADGDVTVTLNQSLEQLKSEESKDIDKILEAPSTIDKGVLDVEEIVILSDDENKKDPKVSEVTQHQHIKKRLRYSDINIDKINKSNVDHSNNIERAILTKTSNVNSIKNAECSLSDIKIPPYFDFSNWNANSKDSFILISSKIIAKPTFKWKLRKALLHLNPGVKTKQLFNFGDVLIRQNIKIAKQAEKIKKNAMRSNLVLGLDIIKNMPIATEHTLLPNKRKEENVIDYEKSLRKSLRKPKKVDTNGDIYLNLSSSKHAQPAMGLTSLKKSSSKSQNKRIIGGSVSLETSPFKPNPLIAEMNTKDWKRTSIDTSQSHIPIKWSKKMISFYTIPCKSKVGSNIDSIFKRFNEKTKAEDWWLDPRDKTGVYQRSQSELKNQRRCCSNCRQKGHMPQKCPEPKKIPVCFLCGDPHHSGYSCQNTVCIKCGEFSTEGECVGCYFHTFRFNSLCERCGSKLHKTPHCPDSWRIFHSTIEGELKIPDKLIENSRRFCCNCAHMGHFSHNCPMPYHTGQQTSPFITNYSNSPVEKGSTDIFLPNTYEEIINSPEADNFLQDLSNVSTTQIQLNSDEKGISLTITGTFEQCLNVKAEIEEFVNTKKRKREELPITKKRRRLK